MTTKRPALLSRLRLRRKWTPTQWFRLAVQLLILLVTAAAIIRHRLNEAAGLSGPTNDSPGVDALSPMGGLETLWSWLSTGQILRHLHTSDLVLLAASVVLVLALGGAFCGWLCPFGAIQEWLYRLRIRYIPWKISLPQPIDRVLRYGRYATLALVLWATYSTGAFFFGDYCPWRAAWNLGSDEIAVGGAIILGLVVVGGLLIERFWCRYLCPLGSFLGLFNKIAPIRLARVDSTCSHCSLCSRQCPMGIDLEASSTISDTTCIRCLVCTDACPKEETLELKAGWWQKAKRVHPITYGAAATAIFLGVIGIGMLTGYWEAYATATSPSIDQQTGQLSTEELKGWRTLQEVTDLWGMPQELLYPELGLDPSRVPPSTQLKELEALTADAPLVIDRTVVADLILRWQKGELK